MITRPGRALSSIDSRSTIRHGRSLPASGAVPVPAQTKPWRTTKPRLGVGSGIPSLVRQGIEAGMFGVHLVSGNPLDLSRRHVGPENCELPILAEQRIVLDRQNHQFGATMIGDLDWCSTGFGPNQPGGLLQLLAGDADHEGLPTL